MDAGSSAEAKRIFDAKPWRLVGRDDELALALTALRTTGSVVLTGEPGVVKTRLAHEVLDRAKRRGTRAEWIAATEAAAAIPLGAVARLVPPRAGRGGRDATRAAVIAMFYRMLRRQGVARTTLVAYLIPVAGLLFGATVLERSRQAALRVAAAVCALPLLVGCGGGGGAKTAAEVPKWATPPNQMELARKAGLTPERAEGLEYHVHAHLDIFLNGKRIAVPGGIGIDITDPAVVGDDALGFGLERECDEACISPLHTHQPDGVLHTETTTPQPNTLGQFFTEWNVHLDGVCVGDYCDDVTIYVNGHLYDGDPREIELSDGKEIAIVIGSAPDSIPSEFP